MVELSSTEAVFIALVEAIKEALWITEILKDLSEGLTGPVFINKDNQSCIKMFQYNKYNHRTKHITSNTISSEVRIDLN